MEDINNNRGVDRYWAYEVLMEVFYGDKVFEYINSKG